MILLINLIRIPFLYISSSTPYSIVFQEEEGGGYLATAGELQVRLVEEASEGDSTRKVGCWFWGVDPRGIRS